MSSDRWKGRDFGGGGWFSMTSVLQLAWELKSNQTREARRVLPSHQCHPTLHSTISFRKDSNTTMFVAISPRMRERGTAISSKTKDRAHGGRVPPLANPAARVSNTPRRTALTRQAAARELRAKSESSGGRLSVCQFCSHPTAARFLWYRGIGDWRENEA
jgi:hypothetical protein